MDDGHHLASCDNYIAAAGIRPPSTTCDKVTVSVVLHRESDQARSRTIHNHDRSRLDITPKTTEQNLIVCTSKSEDEVTNNKKNCA